MSETSTAAPSEAPDISASREFVSSSAGLALLCLAQFMVVLDVSIVNVALRSIPHALGFNQTALQWVINAHQRLRVDVRRVSAARRSTVLAARSTNRRVY
jgi:hypothetical protein